MQTPTTTRPPGGTAPLCPQSGQIPPIEHRPCFVPGISDEVYHSDRASVSSSTLKTLALRSPAHAKAERDEPRAETPALITGRGGHGRVLEPDTFPSRFATGPKVDRRTKAGKAQWTRFTNEHPGATILSAADGAIIEGIAASVEAHPIACRAVRGGQAELSGYFTDSETGIPCRIRPDYLRVRDGIMVDLKTTLDASAAAFQRSIRTFGYHLQAAMYAHGFEVITGEPLRDFLFLTVEKTRPYAVAVYRLDEDALEAGRRLYRRALRTWADCLASNRWPAYSDRVESISLPPWDLARLLEEPSDAHV